MLNQFSRTELLLGKEAMDKLSKSRVAVFGVGGHAMAAGCTIYGKPDKARDMLLSVIDEVWK